MIRVLVEQPTLELIEEIRPLALANYAEIGGPSELTYDVQYYEELAEHGLLEIVAVRDAQGVLEGFLALVLHCDNKQGGEIVAVEDGFYIKPHLRSKGIGKEMLSVAESKSQSLGADSILIGVPAASKMLEDEGYSLVKYMYRKVI